MQEILAVNASAAIRKLTQQLAAAGFDVRFDESRSANIILPLNVPAAIILSVHNEWEAAQDSCLEIRRSDQKVPILVISRRTDPATKATFLDLGADDYLEEPLAVEELIARLRSIIRRQSSRMNFASA